MDFNNLDRPVFANEFGLKRKNKHVRIFIDPK